MNPLIFPCVLMFLDVCAAVVYAMHRDFYMTGYWLFAAGITACATLRAHS